MANRAPTGFLKGLADAPMVAMAVGMAILLARTVYGRISHPFDLEWMEGGMLLHASRVANGQAIYVPPSIDFIPFIYPPMYPWLVGGLSNLGLPLDYTLGRAVSIAGVVLAGAVLAAAVRKEGGSWALGIGGAALFWATYPACGAFFDLVRNDGLQVGLIASSLLACRCGAVRSAGLLLTAAFLTKHTAALYGVCSLWWLHHHQGRGAALRYIRWSVVPALAATAWLTLASDGLFWTYVVEVPSAHPFIAKRFFLTAPGELMMALPWATAIMAVALLIGRRVASQGSRFWLAHGAMAVFLSAVMRGHHGGYMNVLMPGLWVMALGGALAVLGLRKHWPSLALRTATSVLVAWQLWSAQWQPDRYVPTPADLQAGEAVVERLRQVDGRVLAPWQPWMPVQAGHSGSIALIALWDIDHEDGPLYDEAQVIADAIAAQDFAAVLTAKARLRRGLRQHYRRTTMERPSGSALYPKTGWKVRPHSLWVPKGE
ncbi:MAG: hypothetical protein VX127_14890 [Myxococcota bacterium]|nr:hypothetical protein [Myxococcota bacterium]